MYIQSRAEKIGQGNVNGIVNFLRDHVFKHEERFASYNYNSCRSFGDYSNTPLEGTNGGLKYCNFAVKPNMQIPKSASFMICQDENKYIEKLRVAYSNFSKTKLYGFKGESGKATRRIVPGALGEMAQQIGLASSYCSLRIDQANWAVQIAIEQTCAVSMDSRKLMPIFRRLRYVRRDELGGFHCTCPYTKMYGIPCRHVAHVIQSYCIGAYFFTHHDVDIRWWTTYSTLASLKDPNDLEEPERVIKAELIQIRLYKKLCIGNRVELKPFHSEVCICGSQSSNQFEQLSLSEAKAKVFVEADKPYPINYNISRVELALLALGGGYNGLRKIYSLSYSNENQDLVGGNETDTGFNICSGDDICSGDEIDSDFTSRVIERPRGKIDHHQVMKSVYKSLWDAFENCTDEFFHEMKQECETASRAMLIKVQQHIVQNSGKVNLTNSGTVSCRPINVLNVAREHRKQNQW